MLLVRNVNVRADPIDFDLMRTLNGKPFPSTGRDRSFGTVKGRGGPLTHFVVDDARGRFEDAHVHGAVSRFAAKGGLDILFPAFTAFHGFDVDAIARPSLDRVSLSGFPRLGGTSREQRRSIRRGSTSILGRAHRSSRRTG